MTEYTPNPSQRQFHNAVLEYRWTAFVGGVRCGKSRAMIEQIIHWMEKFPGIKVMGTRKFEEDLDGTFMQQFYETCPAPWIADTRQKRKVCLWKNGSSILFKGLYTRQGRLQKVGSLTFGLIGIEEADELTYDDLLLLKARLSQPEIPEAFRRGLLAANPPTIAHWLYRQFGPDRPNGHGMVRGKTADNVSNLGEEYLKELERDYPAAWRQRFLEGEFGVSFKGVPVIQGFTPSAHVRSQAVNPELPILRGWDFGFSRPAVTWWQFDGLRWHWLDTLLGQGIHLRDLIPQVLSRTAGLGSECQTWDACDFAGHQRRDNADQTSVEILRKSRIYPFSRKSASAYEGVDLIQAAVSRAQLTVEPTNQLGIEALAGGWQVENPVEGRDRDQFRILKDGVYDHIGDSVRYLFVNWHALKPTDRPEPVQPWTLGWYEQQVEAAKHVQELMGNEGFSLDQCLAVLR